LKLPEPPPSTTLPYPPGRENSLSILEFFSQILPFIPLKALTLDWPIKIVRSHPNDIQYCPLLAPINQTSQEVTYLGTTLAEARLTAEL
jgi:hypothetical protein